MLKIPAKPWMIAAVSLLAIGLSMFRFQADTPAVETLLKELRCVTCPNQNIADSTAPVASAMREEIILRFAHGESTAAIRQSMLSKYGDYLSYRPMVKPQTYLLWFAPILMIVIGFVFWFSFLNKRKSQ